MENRAYRWGTWLKAHFSWRLLIALCLQLAKSLTHMYTDVHNSMTVKYYAWPVSSSTQIRVTCGTIDDFVVYGWMTLIKVHLGYMFLTVLCLLLAFLTHIYRRIYIHSLYSRSFGGAQYRRNKNPIARMYLPTGKNNINSAYEIKANTRSWSVWKLALRKLIKNNLPTDKLRTVSPDGSALKQSGFRLDAACTVWIRGRILIRIDCLRERSK